MRAPVAGETARFVAAQTRISVAINVGLSLAFFVALFGWSGAELSWWAPDRLAIDFVPQSLAIGVMSALVPGLVARRRFARATPVAKVFRVAALAALASLLLAMSAITLVAVSESAAISYAAAAVIKVTFGAALGWLVTPRAVRTVLNHPT